MLYENDPGRSGERSSDSELDPRQLLRDLDALVAAGLVAPVRDASGELRLTPTIPLELGERGLRAS